MRGPGPAGNVMDENQKKDSLFASLMPPAPAQAAVSGVSGHAEEAISALNRRMEAFEKNIVSLLEKKMSERAAPALESRPLPPAAPPLAPPPAQPPHPPVAEGLLLRKLEEMEKRIGEFQERNALGAAQMKNIEESKISARREIGELLKVVREQQKYSELDRQMHDQLEKAWSRVEETEKRFMEFYGRAAAKPRETAAPAELASEVMKIVEARLQERLQPLEAALKGLAAGIEALPGASRGTEARVAELSAGIDARLAEFSAAVDMRLGAFTAEARRLHADAAAGKERVDAIFSEMKKIIAATVRAGVAEGGGTFIRHVDEASLEARARLDVMSKMLLGHIDELFSLVNGSLLKMEQMESSAQAGNGRTLAAIAGMQSGIEKNMRAHVADALAEARAENTRQMGKMREICRLSASSLAAAVSVSGSVAEIKRRLDGVMAGLHGFARSLERLDLESLLGVSGAMVRRSFEGAKTMIAGLEEAASAITRAKNEMEANVRAISREDAESPGGAGGAAEPRPPGSE